jgi:glycosyltransferase involved in cell wall biosynthesis
MTYYRPRQSGPIVYTERLGMELERRGHRMTVLTSDSDGGGRPPDSATLRVERVPVWARISKGVLAPRLPLEAVRLLREHDLMLLQIPQLEAPLLALLARAAGKPVVLNWHCDIRLAPGVLNAAAEGAVLAGSWVAARLAHRIVASSRDYARHSPFMSACLGKVEAIPPAVSLPAPAPDAVRAFRSAHGFEGRPAIGICARLSPEKGIDCLLDALPMIHRELPGAVVLHAGDSRTVPGESAYRDRVSPRFADAGAAWKELGVVPDQDLPAFYAACDVTVLPSLNRTEAFGLAQVESMLAGTPVVVSDLPGLRVPVQTTAMGQVVPPGDAPALAAAISAVLRDPARFRRSRESILAHYSVERTASGFEAIFQSLR